MRSKTFI